MCVGFMLLQSQRCGPFFDSWLLFKEKGCSVRFLHDNFTTTSDWLLYPGRNYHFPKINILFHFLAPGKILIIATMPEV